MEIKPIINEFRTEDLSEFKLVQNRQTNALWLHKEDSLLKIHLRVHDEDCIKVTLFRFHPIGDFSGINYRIETDDENIFISTLVINPGNMNHEDEHINLEDHATLVTESGFFQQSLLTDFGDVSCEDIQTIIKVRNLVLAQNRGFINATV